MAAENPTTVNGCEALREAANSLHHHAVCAVDALNALCRANEAEEGLFQAVAAVAFRLSCHAEAFEKTSVALSNK